MLTFLKITVVVAILLYLFELWGIFRDKSSSLLFKCLIAFILFISTALYVYAYRCTFNENLAAANWLTKTLVISVTVIYTELKALAAWMLNKPQ